MSPLASGDMVEAGAWVPAPGWADLPLAANWSAVTAVPPPQWAQDSFGRVRFRGAVQWNQGGITPQGQWIAAAGALPPIGFDAARFAALCNPAGAAAPAWCYLLAVMSGGNVQVTPWWFPAAANYAGSWLSLDGFGYWIA